MDFPGGGSSSSAVAVKTALVAGFKELTGLKGVQVVYGNPVGGMEREVIYLGRVTWGNHSPSDGEDWATLGARARAEIYAIELIIDVQAVDTEPIVVEAKAFQYFAAIEQYLRSSPTISYGKLTSFQLVPLQAVVFPYTDGQECEIRANIRVECRK